MTSGHVIDGIVQLSCVLSMLGSMLVILTWAYPRKNRSKHGRILLLWLSIADLLSSCVYFIQTFHRQGKSICEISSLLGIFFPVASFLWTDCIAFFLYLVVSNRTCYQPYNWDKLLRNFHIFVWTLSILTIILVFAFGHAGYASDDDGNDGAADNTGGWCWITADSPTERFIWEIIGGKFIEWTSCLIILPYLYTSVYFQLARVEGQIEARTTIDTRETAVTTTGQEHHQNIKLEHVNQTSTILPSVQNVLISNNTTTTVVRHSPVEGMPKVKSIESLYDMSDLSGNAFIDTFSNNSTTNRISLSPSEINTPIHTQSNQLNQPLVNFTNNTDNIRKIEPRLTSTNSYTSSSHSRFFNKFYIKLAAVPIILICIRLWSSIRIILQFARPHKNNADSFFEVMQAFFDPSQGIFNALIFVFASTEDRMNLYNVLIRAQRYSWKYLCYFCCYCMYYTKRTSRQSSREKSSLNSSNEERGLRDRLIQPRAKADSCSTGGHPSLLLDDEFECDSAERMSEFSFDLTEIEAV